MIFPRAGSLQSQDAGSGDAPLAKGAEQQASRLVVAHHAHRQHGDAQRGQVVNRVATAAGNHGALAVLEDQHRRFARDAGDFAVDEFVGHQIGDHRDGEAREGVHDLAQALELSGVLQIVFSR